MPHGDRYEREFAESVANAADRYLEELISTIGTNFFYSQLDLMRANPEEYYGSVASFQQQASDAAEDLRLELDFLVETKKFGLSLLESEALKLATQFREKIREGRYF